MGKRGGGRKLESAGFHPPGAECGSLVEQRTGKQMRSRLWKDFGAGRAIRAHTPRVYIICNR